MNQSFDLNASSDAATIPELLPPPSAPLPCDDLLPGADCLPRALSNEQRFLGVLSIVLACAVCALYVLVMVLVVLVHKLSSLWIKSLVRPAPDPNDPRKGLLQETKSSLRGASDSKPEGKKKKATFTEDTSCAPTRDVDEEDL